MTAANLPKTLQRFASKIADYENDTAQQNGHWVYYKHGFKSASDPLGAQHQDHEDSLRELACCAREVMVCDCVECKGATV